MMFHCVTAVASAVAGGAADVPMTPNPARTATSAAANQMDRFGVMSPPLSSARPCYELPLSCSACSKSLPHDAGSAGPSCTCLPMLILIPPSDAVVRAGLPSKHGEEPPLEEGRRTTARD